MIFSYTNVNDNVYEHSLVRVALRSSEDWVVTQFFLLYLFGIYGGLDLNKKDVKVLQ